MHKTESKRSNTETTFQFQSRKIEATISHLTESGETLGNWKILRQANISKPSKGILGSGFH